MGDDAQQSFQESILDCLAEADSRKFESTGDAARNFALARTSLEDALMRFNRGVHVAAGTAAW